MLQLKHHKAMWCNGCNFRIKMLNDKMKTLDCGITAVFKVTNISSRSDKNPEENENRYTFPLESMPPFKMVTRGDLILSLFPQKTNVWI
jgi:hypothetical protein